jgi:hypothetical protein
MQFARCRLRPDDSFSHEKAGRKVEVIAWSTHCYGDRSRLPRVGWPIGELNFERLFDRETIQDLTRYLTRDSFDRRLQHGVVSRVPVFARSGFIHDG